MFIGVLLGLAAGALWGLIYIAPLWLPEYNPVLIALARFIAFGVVSLPALWFLREPLKTFSRADIWEAFRLPFFGNVIFYSLLTTCIRLAGAPLAGMFMAIIPVLVAVVSNLRCRNGEKPLSWGVITPPLVVIFFGLLVANSSEFAYMTAAAGSPTRFLIGVAFGIASVIAWTWFSIKNSEWLLEHPEKNVSCWTALQGCTVLPVVVVGFAILSWPLGLMDTSVTLMGPAPWRFLGVGLMIGFLCSWVAMLCWNQMSQRLPAGLGGQLIVFESIFSVIYALVWRGEAPSPTLVIGFSIVLIGVWGSLYVFRKAQEEQEKRKASASVSPQAPSAAVPVAANNPKRTHRA